MKKPPYEPLFSHQFPVNVALPGSDFSLTIFPACIEVIKTDTDELVHSFVLDEPSRFLSHTTFVDLLALCVVVEGETKAGFQRICFYRKGSVWTLTSQKRDLCLVNRQPLRRGEEIELFPVRSYERHDARLVLISPQKNRWEQLLDRNRWPALLEQLFLYPSLSSGEEEPRDSLLLRLKEDIYDKKNIENNLIRLLGMGFSGVCVPRVGKTVCSQFGEDFWPYLSLDRNLSYLQAFIHSLFVREEGNSLFLLPLLLPSLASGQVIHDACLNKKVLMSFDWRKGRVRRLFLRAADECALQLYVPGCSEYRLRIVHEKGVRTERSDQVLCLEKEKIYLLDNFS